MKYSALALALLLACQPVAAKTTINHEHKCDITSDWSVRTHRRAFVFARKDHSPGEIGIGGGRLFVDGKEATLVAADQARVARLEQEMNALVPQLREIVVQAVDIAFDALVEVARGLGSDPGDTVADLQRAQKKLHAHMDAQPLSALDGDAIGEAIAPVMSEFVPEIIGGAVKGALKAAFGGAGSAAEFEQRMQKMERQLDTKVEARAKDLEPLADAMCQRLQTIDRIDDELEYRLPDGARLDLLRVRRDDESMRP
jgi:hypothetical protein